jgi:hypothetical protein
MSVIKNNQTFVNGLTLNGAVTLGAAASFDGGANVLGNVANPVAAQDVVTKAYGDANYGGSEPSNTVQTTDATPTALSTIAIASDSAVTINAYISGANADFSDVTGGSVQATVRNDSGTLTIVGTSLPIVNASTTGTFDIIVSGTNALVQVTGLAATTYNWTDRYFTVVQA